MACPWVLDVGNLTPGPWGWLSHAGSSATFTGTKFKVVSLSATYIIYSLSKSITFEATTSTLRSTAQLTGVLRMAFLANTAHETTLDTYAPNYPTAVNTDYTFSGDSAILTFV